MVVKSFDLGTPARSAHIPGVGHFGSGFLHDPKQVRKSLKDKGVDIVRTSDVLPKGQPLPQKVAPQHNLFPGSLGPLSIDPAVRLTINLLGSASERCGGSYELVLEGLLKPFTLLDKFDNTGVVSPLVPLPQSWPRETKRCVSKLCWASPMRGL